jgi:hypothetical protein
MGSPFAGRAEKRGVARRAWATLGGLLLLVAAAPVRAQLVFDANDVLVNFKPVCTGPVQQVNLGDLHVTISAAAGIEATFTVDPAIRGPGSGGTRIWDCLNLHYIQIIRADDCPATVAGVPAGDPTFPFPVVDTPPNGWDYIYMDTNGTPGIQADERVPGNVNGPAQADDAVDVLPWYHTPEEEARKPGSGFEGVGGFVECVSYVLKDVPGFCPDAGVTSFTTFLVAEPTSTCLEAECLLPFEFVLLAGFDWTWTTAGVSVMAASVNSTAVDSALVNTGFTALHSWDAKDFGVICCDVPETSSMAVSGFGIVLFAVYLFRRRRAAPLR